MNAEQLRQLTESSVHVVLVELILFLADELDAWSRARYVEDAKPYAKVHDTYLAGIYDGHDQAATWLRKHAGQ